jgi:hypothetical protein
LSSRSTSRGRVPEEHEPVVAGLGKLVDRHPGRKAPVVEDD